MKTLISTYIGLLLVFTITFAYSHEYQVSICAIFQNEANYLKEWIDYHHKIGVEHFYLYNNDSLDNPEAVLQPYIDEGIVTLTHWHSVPEEMDFWHFSFYVQTGAYKDAIERSKHRTKWLAILDTDEFILPLSCTLNELLHTYRNHYAIALQWACFGTSNVERCPQGETLRYLTKRASLDSHVNGWSKCIVRPSKVKDCTNPHFCIMKHDQTAIVIPREIIRLNHYWTRDEFFFHHAKIPRHIKWGGLEEDLLKRGDEMNKVYDTEILRFL
jgi:Glycosyltransferase family 92